MPQALEQNDRAAEHEPERGRNQQQDRHGRHRPEDQIGDRGLVSGLFDDADEDRRLRLEHSDQFTV